MYEKGLGVEKDHIEAAFCIGISDKVKIKAKIVANIVASDIRVF
jgi:hypothetical protein